MERSNRHIRLIGISLDQAAASNLDKLPFHGF
jgi:hypothetical protein